MCAVYCLTYAYVVAHSNDGSEGGWFRGVGHDGMRFGSRAEPDTDGSSKMNLGSLMNHP